LKPRLLKQLNPLTHLLKNHLNQVIIFIVNFDQLSYFYLYQEPESCSPASSLSKRLLLTTKQPNTLTTEAHPRNDKPLPLAERKSDQDLED
jgi:hypothetical protein